MNVSTLPSRSFLLNHSRMRGIMPKVCISTLVVRNDPSLPLMWGIFEGLERKYSNGLPRPQHIVNLVGENCMVNAYKWTDETWRLNMALELLPCKFFIVCSLLLQYTYTVYCNLVLILYLTIFLLQYLKLYIFTKIAAKVKWSYYHYYHLKIINELLILAVLILY